MPTPQQSNVFNAIIVALVEHGLTPSVIVARMTYSCAPEALQAAVAAGLCGLGNNVVGSMEGAARYLSEALPKDAPADTDLDALAAQIVAGFRKTKTPIPGLGHVVHTQLDPRTPRLFAIAEENGFSGRYVRLMQLVHAEAQRATGRTHADQCDRCDRRDQLRAGLPVEDHPRLWRDGPRHRPGRPPAWRKSGNPISREVWTRTEQESSAHLRPGAAAS